MTKVYQTRIRLFIYFIMYYVILCYFYLVRNRKKKSCFINNYIEIIIKNYKKNMYKFIKYYINKNKMLQKNISIKNYLFILHFN